MFQKVDGLSVLESNNDWDLAIGLLTDLRNQHREEPGCALRLIAEYWFILSLENCLTFSRPVDTDAYQNTMIQVLRESDYLLQSDPFCLCITGYMMRMLPFLFIQEDSRDTYEGIAAEGTARMLRARQAAPDDLLIYMLCEGMTASYDENSNLRNRLKDQLEALEWDDTEISKYFHWMVCGQYRLK